MRRRRVLIALSVALFILIVALLVWLRARAAPEPVRLLPEGDAFIYANLKPLHIASALASMPEAHRDPEYEDFVRGTGFQFERDLDQAAFAIHLPRSAENSADETRFSEVFVGRFNYDKLTEYLRRKSSSVEHYRDTEVFTIPVEGRTVRVAVLSVDMVAVSNVADRRVVEGIIDRSHEVGLPFGGPRLVREYHSRVPFGSLAWGIGAVSRSGRKNLSLPGGLELPFPPNTTLVGSVRSAGNIYLKVEAFTPTEEGAKSLSENLSLVLTLFRSIQSNLSTTGSDADVKSFFDSMEVKQEKNRAVVNAIISPAFIQKAMQEAPAAVAAPPTTPPRQAKKHPRRK